MAAHGTVTGRFQNSDYTINFQQNSNERILALYSSKGEMPQQRTIEDISRKILKERLDQGDILHIQQGRVQGTAKKVPSLLIEAFEKCVLHSLYKLLARSRSLFQAQMNLSNTISTRYFKEGNPRKRQKTKYRFYNDTVKNELGKKGERSHWVLGSRVLRFGCAAGAFGIRGGKGIAFLEAPFRGLRVR